MDESSVSLKRVFIPLLFYNSDESVREVYLGQNNFERPYNDFFLESFEKTAKTKSNFCLIPKKGSTSDYSLDIAIDSCSSTAIYSQYDLFVYLIYAHISSSKKECSIAEAYLSASVKLKKADSVVFEKKYAVSRIMPPIINKHADKKLVVKYMVINICEALSITTKEFIEQIISDLNRYNKTKMRN